MPWKPLPSVEPLSPVFFGALISKCAIHSVLLWDGMGGAGLVSGGESPTLRRGQFTALRVMSELFERFLHCVLDIKETIFKTPALKELKGEDRTPLLDSFFGTPSTPMSRHTHSEEDTEETSSEEDAPLTVQPLFFEDLVGAVDCPLHRREVESSDVFAKVPSFLSRLGILRMHPPRCHSPLCAQYPSSLACTRCAPSMSDTPDRACDPQFSMRRNSCASKFKWTSVGQSRVQFG